MYRHIKSRQSRGKRKGEEKAPPHHFITVATDDKLYQLQFFKILNFAKINKIRDFKEIPGMKLEETKIPGIKLEETEIPGIKLEETKIPRNMQLRIKTGFLTKLVIQPFCRSDKVISTSKVATILNFFLLNLIKTVYFMYCAYFIYYFAPALLGSALGQI